MRTCTAFAFAAVLLASPVAHADSSLPGNLGVIYNCALVEDCRILILRPNGEVGSFRSSSVPPEARPAFWLWLQENEKEINSFTLYTDDDPEWEEMLRRYQAQPKPVI